MRWTIKKIRTNIIIMNVVRRNYLTVSNAKRYLNAFTTIEKELCRMLDLGQRRRFYELVRMASKINPVVARYKADLLEYGDLRNAIVHTRAGGEVIAEPNERTVEAIERIAAYLLEPPRVIPLFRKDVLTLSAGSPVNKAIRLMSKHGYSQIPIKDGNTTIALLTTTTVVRWLAEALEAGTFNPQETPVGSILDYTEHEHNFKFVAAATSLFEVHDLFYLYKLDGKKLEAVLISEHGRPDEPILGIITIWHLPLVQRELDRNGGHQLRNT